MKPSTTAERLQEAMNIRGLKQVDVLSRTAALTVSILEKPL